MKQCLIIDDSSSIRKVAKRILKDFGYDTVEAENSEEALKKCAETMPDSIIVDWAMPDVDSTRLMADIRKLDGGNQNTAVYLFYDIASQRVNRLMLEHFTRRASQAP